VQAVILAAGYATRLHPLTLELPKPLLAVGDRTILDHLVDALEALPELTAIHLVTNHRFADRFAAWRERRAARLPIMLLDDGSTANENRLGAVADLALAIERHALDDDLLVSAADNLYRFPLAGLVAAFRARPAVWLCVHEVASLEARRRTGIAVLGADDRVLAFAEKPAEPRSAWGVPPLYAFPRRALPRVREHLARGGIPDSPGNLTEWLCTVEPVYAHRVTGSILEVGSPETLAAARRALGG
jgi:glucose-1-phosphate thymidylyltransferase